MVDRLTWNSFCTIVRMLRERDKVIYQLLLALEIEDSAGNVGVGEREFRYLLSEVNAYTI